MTISIKVLKKGDFHPVYKQALVPIQGESKKDGGGWGGGGGTVCVIVNGYR